VTGVESWWPTGDPADHLAAMLRAVDWRRLRGGQPLKPYQAHCIRESALWVVEGRTDNPLAYGVGDTIEDLALLDVARAVLLWVQDATSLALIGQVHVACHACARLGDLMDDPESDDEN
jgi:hypothetical protein